MRSSTMREHSVTSVTVGADHLFHVSAGPENAPPRGESGAFYDIAPFR